MSRAYAFDSMLNASVLRLSWPFFAFLVVATQLLQTLAAPDQAPFGNMTNPVLSSMESAPIISATLNLSLIKGVGVAAICVEVLLAGFVPRLLLRVGPRWLALVNVC